MKIALVSFVVLVTILVVGQTLASKGDDVEISCMQRHNVTRDEYTSLSQGKILEGMNSKFKCFGHCLAHDMGYLDKVGKLNVTKVEKDVEMRKGDMATVMECRAKHDMEVDPCEYVFQIWACILRQILKGLNAN